MADLLSTGISGLLASRAALDITGHNIANVNTPGYSRQNALLSTRDPQQLGNFYIGQGVNVVGVQRAYSQFLTNALRGQESSLQRAETFNTLTTEINNFLAGSNNLQTSLSSFYAGIQDVANNPTSSAARQALIGKANSLTQTFRSLDTQLNQQREQINQRISDSVASINGITQSIAELNDQIETQSANGMPPNDLLDRRDELIRELSGKVGIQTSRQGNSINVFTGNGQILVNGNQSQKLQVATNSYDPSRLEIHSPTGFPISNQISGGTLGGLMDYRNNVLEPARNQLGRTAIAFATTMNQQHRQGMDLNGQLGGDMFTLPAPQALESSNNTGSATLSASVANLGALSTNDYTLRFDGANWSAFTSSGTPVTMTGTGTAADPLVFDGMEVVVSGAAAAGDSFAIYPTKNAATDISLALTHPNQVAAASPVKAVSATGNQSTVQSLDVTDVNDPNLLNPVNIQFLSPTTYSVNGGPAITYTPGFPIQINGWSLNLDGTPVAGDQIDVRANIDGSGDNKNALALGKIANQGILDGGAVTIGGAYGRLVTDTGTIGAQASLQLETQTSLYNQAMQSQQSVAGVNLEEEAANLIRYQHAYQAAAQAINTASTIFDTLIGALRR